MEHDEKAVLAELLSLHFKTLFLLTFIYLIRIEGKKNNKEDKFVLCTLKW